MGGFKRRGPAHRFQRGPNGHARYQELDQREASMVGDERTNGHIPRLLIFSGSLYLTSKGFTSGYLPAT